MGTAEDLVVAERSDVSVDALDGRQRLRRWARTGLLLGLLSLTGWATTTAVLVWGVREDLVIAEREIRSGRSALEDLQADEAAAHLARASARLDRSVDRIGSFPVRVAAGLPVIRANLLAVEALVLGAEDVVRAARGAVDVAIEVGDSVESLAPRNGRVPLQPWVAFGPVLRVAAVAFADAHDRVEAVQEAGLVDQVRGARARFLDLAAPAAAQAERAAAMAEIIPAFMGADGPRSYFVAAANPAEPRGSGGLIGAWSILVVDDGAFEFGPFAPIQDLPDLIPSPLPAPEASIGDRYRSFGGTGVWRNLNMTPDFPSAAQQIEQLYAEVVGVELDGTILVDPHSLELLLDPDDVVEVPGVASVPASRIVRFLVTDAYAQIESSERRKALLGEVAAGIVGRFLTGGADRDPATAVQRLATAIGDEHVMVHAADPAVQQRLELLDVAGAFPVDGGDLLAVVTNDGSATKLGAFLEREMTYRVQLLADGGATAQLEVRHTNAVDATGLPQYVVGPNVDFLSAGEALVLVSTYCAASCTPEQVPGPGWEGRVSDVAVELGHPVVSTWVAMTPGAHRTLSYDMAIAEAWTPTADGGRYHLTYRHQSSIAPVRLVVEVVAPGGYRFAGAGPAADADGRTVRWTHRAGADIEFDVAMQER